MKKSKVLAVTAALILGLSTLTIAPHILGSNLKHEAQQKTIYYDIPLDKELQSYITKKAAEYNVPVKIVYALIQCESGFNPNAISKTNDYGLMQINKINHSRLATKLKIKDFLDAKQNALAGIYMLSESLNATKSGDIQQAIMIYGLGFGGASNLFNQGIYSTAYSRNLLEIADSFEVLNENK